MKQHKFGQKQPFLHHVFSSRLPGWPGSLVNTCLAMVLVSFLVLLVSCTDEAKMETEPEGQYHTYVVRGIIRQLPSADDPAKQLLIMHEAIPGWVNEQGYEIGMPGMTMPFPPAPGVDLSTFAVGDPVLFSLQLNWESAPRLQVTKLVHRTE